MKQMWDKKVLVEVIHKESPKVEVDSELSETSENPVQNKVITEALGEVLPDTTGQTDKYLKVGSDGLEWADGGGKLYVHNIFAIDTHYFSVNVQIISNSDTPFTKQTLVEYLYDKGYNTNVKHYCASGYIFSSGAIAYFCYGIRVNARNTNSPNLLCAKSDGSDAGYETSANIGGANIFRDVVSEL